MLFCLSLIYMWGVQPYLMIIGIILLTLVYSINMSYMIGSFWFSYMLILIIMSGVLILFMYMISLIPNSKFELSNLIYISVLMYMFIMYKLNIYLFTYEDWSLMTFKMWDGLTSIYSLYFVIFLFLIMVMVVWITNFGIGAVRNF